MKKALKQICFILISLNLLPGCGSGFRSKEVTPPPAVIVIPPQPTIVTVTIQVTGAGTVAILDQTNVCDSSVACPVHLVQNTETQFQAVFDPSTGLQLVGFTGCTALEAGGTICDITATQDSTVTALFSLPPVANFIFFDDGTTVFISLFDESSNLLIFQPPDLNTTVSLVASNGTPIVCTLGGDLTTPVPQSNCLSDPDYLFAFAADASVTSLSVTLSITDSYGLNSSIQQTIR